VKTQLLWYRYDDGAPFNALVQKLLDKILALNQKIANIIKTIIYNPIKNIFGADSLGQLITDLLVDVLVADFMKVPFIIV